MGWVWTISRRNALRTDRSFDEAFPFQYTADLFESKRLSGTVHSAGLKFHGISVSMSLLGHRLAIRSRVCFAQALGSTLFILHV